MAENKTKKTAVSVESFLNAVANETQRADSFRLVAMMKEITGEPAKMWGPTMVGFGDYHYVYESGREGDIFQVGFSPRTGKFALYIGCGDKEAGALLKKLGKCKVTGGCLYINKLADVDLAVLRELIRAKYKRVAGTSKPAKKKK